MIFYDWLTLSHVNDWNIPQQRPEYRPVWRVTASDTRVSKTVLGLEETHETKSHGFSDLSKVGFNAVLRLRVITKNRRVGTVKITNVCIDVLWVLKALSSIKTHTFCFRRWASTVSARSLSS